MNTDKIYAEAIANEYSVKNTSKVVALKKLDKKAKQPANIFAFTFGTMAALILGTGMCLSMKIIGSGIGMFVLGIVLGIVGIASYIAAGLQDVISGWLIERGTTTLADGSREYDFTWATIFWITASIISFLLPLLNWKYGKKDRED